MFRRSLLLASLFLTSSAFATWNPKFSSTDERLVAGETTTIQLRAVWSGFVNPAVYPFTSWVCGSDNENVAHVEGGLETQGGAGNVMITAIAPGTAYVRIVAPSGNFSGGQYVKITVVPNPVTVSIAPSARTTTVGRRLTLVAISPATAVTFTWYSGHVGDTSHPLLGSGNELAVTPAAPGRYSFWVSALAPSGMNTAETTIDVQPAPRRRAVGPR